MRLALLFSGQGQQSSAHLDHLKAHADTSLVKALASALGPVWQSAEGVDLSANVIAQPLIFGYQLAWWRRLQEHVPVPVCAAGYSLGEMAACASAGVFSAEEGVGLCVERARLMDAATLAPMIMLAVLGLGEPLVAKTAAAHGLAIAIRNAAMHFVVTGPVDAIHAAMADFDKAGATRLTLLAVKTPSHTHFLVSAAEAFEARLRVHQSGALSFPVISAVSGRASHTRGDVVQALAQQISTMLQWDRTMETVQEMRPDVVLEVGPGNALSRMLAECAPDIPARSVADFRSVEGVLVWLSRYT